ncbi:MAG: hypothetical protein V3T64_01560 [Myxococcota bacterium]
MSRADRLFKGARRPGAERLGTMKGSDLRDDIGPRELIRLYIDRYESRLECVS